MGRSNCSNLGLFLINSAVSLNAFDSLSSGFNTVPLQSILSKTASPPFLSRVIPFTLLLPVVGVAGGVLALGEAMTMEMVIGGGLIIVGVGIVALRQAAQGEIAPVRPH